MPQEIRVINLAFINSIINLLAIYEVYLFPVKNALKYLIEFGVVSKLYILAAAIYIIVHILFRRYPF